MADSKINYSSKLYMVENSRTSEFYQDPESGLVPAFTLKSDAAMLLKSLYGNENYQIIYAAPCEFFETNEILWDAFFYKDV